MSVHSWLVSLFPHHAANLRSLRNCRTIEISHLVPSVALRISFFAITKPRNDRDQKNRSRNEIEEIFTNRFDWQVVHAGAHMKDDPTQNKEERRHHCDDNEESPEPATTEQRERSCDERQKRKHPDGRWPGRSEITNRSCGENKGRNEGNSVAVTNSIDESFRRDARRQCRCGIHIFILT